MNRVCHAIAAMMLLVATSSAFAEFHLFKIEQLFSNADGTVQFVVLHECCNTNGENRWAGRQLTIGDGPSDPYGFGMAAQASNSITFPSNLPNAATAGRRVLIATQGFAALGLVTPDFTMPDGFLPIGGATLNYAGADYFTYSSLPTDGVSAIDRNGTTRPNVATNFAGVSASVNLSAPVAFVPQIGVWWNPDESGSGYNFDIKNGTIAITIFSYEAPGHSEWYLSSGPMTDNNTKYTGTLDKYRGGQCISCAFTGMPTMTGNDGTISITFTSATSAVLSLPNNRTTNIQPLLPATAPPPAVAFVPRTGVWWNPDESGSGYNFDIKNGTIAITIFSYEAAGHSEWYLSSGPLTDNSTKYTGTLDKYRGGQCISCAFTGMPTMTGNDGTISITFTSATSAVLSLPNNRTTNIQPLL